MASPVTGIPGLTALPYTVPGGAAGLYPGGYGYGLGTPGAGYGVPGGYSLVPTDPTTQLMNGLGPILGGIGEFATSNLGMGTAREAAGMADPFSGQRGAYQTALNTYMGGTSAVNRGLGASGLNFAGSRGAALDQYGQQMGMGLLGQIANLDYMGVGANINAANLGLQAQGQGFNQLGTLAGAFTGNPAMAGQLLNQGRQNQITGLGQGTGAIAAGLGQALPAIQRLIGGSGGFSLPNSTVDLGTNSNIFAGTGMNAFDTAFDPSSFDSIAGTLSSGLGDLPW